MIRKTVGTSKKAHKTEGKSGNAAYSAKPGHCVSYKLGPSQESKLRALKSLEGIWADKDPSFFDE